MGDPNSPFPLSSLLCEEKESSFDEHEDGFLNSYNYVLAENDKEYIEMLVERENSLGFSEDCSIVLENWLKCCRLDAILWILKTRALFGFRFQTAFLSITYFDRFLSKRTIEGEKPWAISLLSVACLILAAKMEECKVPALSEFPVEGFNFETKMIQRMELLVLNTLEWKMGSITPFTFIHYFISKFCNEPQPRDIVSKTEELVLAVTKEMSSMDHRPSVIAAAAVLAATDQSLTKSTVGSKMSVIPSCGYLQNEHVYSCYNLMQELELRKLKTPPSSYPSSTTNAIEIFSLRSADGSKKRRLRFDNEKLP